MKRAPLDHLPFWPRLLSREEAARYVGVAVDTFDQEVHAGIWPTGLRRGPHGGRTTWDRLALDRAADRASGLDGSTAPVLPPPGADLAWKLLDQFRTDIKHEKAERDRRRREDR